MNLEKQIKERKRPTKATQIDVDLELWQKADKKRLALSKKLGKKVFWTDILESLLTEFVKV